MANNPYTPPRAPVADVGSEEFQEIRLWSATGRIGRLRYLAYSFAPALVIGVVVAVVTPVAPDLLPVVAILAYAALVVFAILTAIKRSHDMNWSGWTVLLTIIPLVGFIWIFMPGTRGENRFGAPPPPNTTGVKILGSIAPVIFIVGVLAAIALPAYQEYVKRAQAAESAQPNR